MQTRSPAPLEGELARSGNLVMAEVALEDLAGLASDESIAFVDHAESLKFPRPIRLRTESIAPEPRAKKIAPSVRHGGGKGVLIGIVDVEGFDFAHSDFLSAGKTRFLRIWDQGGSPNPARTAPSANGQRFNYGAELTQTHLDKAIKDAKTAHVSPHDLEPQSQRAAGSHGTHVASIAAGNHGVCPNAEIVAVLVSLPSEDLDDRRRSFYDSTRLIDAIEYLLNFAEKEGKPISINVSLGTNGHAHDGSSVVDRWIDAWLARPGRSVCVAAGNAGQERAESPGDFGYVMGRIHTSGRVAAKGLTHDIDWVVQGDRYIDISENEMEIWYESQDRFQVSIKPPGDAPWIGPISPGEYVENMKLPNNTILSVYNELYHPANGHNYVSIYLSPMMKRPIVGITAGTWIVRLTGLDVRDGRFHGWIERDDPAPGPDGKYYFPSCFSERSNVDSSSVSSLACGERIISVANLDELAQSVHITSSQGPTRNGRLKPDVAAPGTQILAANGFGRPQDPWIAMTGTSMASPYVAGVIGLMLAVEPRLGASQINGILKATARPLPGKSYEWLNDCGFGEINPSECVKAAATAFDRTDIKGRFE